MLRKRCSVPEYNGEIKSPESKSRSTLRPKCLRMDCIGGQYSLDKLHALLWASAYLFQNEMNELLFLISFLHTMFDDALPLNPCHLNFFNLKKCEICL